MHGCFWHQHGDPNCKKAHTPRSNTDYWGPKLARNVARDMKVRCQLKAAGWDVLVLWECESGNPEPLVERLTDFLSP